MRSKVVVIECWLLFSVGVPVGNVFKYRKIIYFKISKQFRFTSPLSFMLCSFLPKIRNLALEVLENWKQTLFAISEYNIGIQCTRDTTVYFLSRQYNTLAQRAVICHDNSRSNRKHERTVPHIKKQQNDGSNVSDRNYRLHLKEKNIGIKEMV